MIEKNDEIASLVHEASLSILDEIRVKSVSDPASIEILFGSNPGASSIFEIVRREVSSFLETWPRLADLALKDFRIANGNISDLATEIVLASLPSSKELWEKEADNSKGKS